MMDSFTLVAVSGMEVTTLYYSKANSYDEKLKDVVRRCCRCVVLQGLWAALSCIKLRRTLIGSYGLALR